MLFHLSYIKAFRKYAESIMNELTEFTQIGNYANLLTDKANQLINRAALNGEIDLVDLEKDIFETGKIYKKKFSDKFQKPKPSQIGIYAKKQLVENSTCAYSRA